MSFKWDQDDNLKHSSDFLMYMHSFAKEQGYQCVWRGSLQPGGLFRLALPPTTEGTTLVIMGTEDRALELDCEGTTVNYYYFTSYTNDAIHHCDEVNLENPDSVQVIMSWLKRVRGST